VPLNPPAGYVLGKNCNDLKDPLGEGADILTIPAPPEGVEALALFNTEKDARQWEKQNASEYYPIEADTEELRTCLAGSWTRAARKLPSSRKVMTRCDSSSPMRSGGTLATQTSRDTSSLSN
jgi:hypothetical protein